MTMGEYIKELRLERGMSQEELGRIVGVNRAAVQKWEKGSVENIKRSTIKQLADFFQVSPCDLMQWGSTAETESKENECDQFSACHDSDAYRIVQSFLRLDYEDRQTVAGMIDILLEKDKYREKEAI